MYLAASVIRFLFFPPATALAESGHATENYILVLNILYHCRLVLLNKWTSLFSI